jgi:hypothetical protein
MFGAVIEKLRNYFQKIAIAIGEFFSAQDLIRPLANSKHNHPNILGLACIDTVTDLEL